MERIGQAILHFVESFLQKRNLTQRAALEIVAAFVLNVFLLALAAYQVIFQADRFLLGSIIPLTIFGSVIAMIGLFYQLLTGDRESLRARFFLKVFLFGVAIIFGGFFYKILSLWYSASTDPFLFF